MWRRPAPDMPIPFSTHSGSHSTPVLDWLVNLLDINDFDWNSWQFVTFPPFHIFFLHEHDIGGLVTSSSSAPLFIPFYLFISGGERPRGVQDDTIGGISFYCIAASYGAGRIGVQFPKRWIWGHGVFSCVGFFIMSC
jgi:hypothetical protein